MSGLYVLPQYRRLWIKTFLTNKSSLLDKPKKPAKERKVRQANTLKAKEAKENLPPAADDADKENEENNWEEMLIHGLDILL